MEKIEDEVDMMPYAEPVGRDTYAKALYDIYKGGCGKPLPDFAALNLFAKQGWRHLASVLMSVDS